MPSFAIGNIEADAAKNAAVVDRVFLALHFCRTENCIGHVSHTHTYVHTYRQKACLYRHFWISNRNGTDAINEPSSVINRFPLETVIHRRLALSQLIFCRYRRSNSICIRGIYVEYTDMYTWK